MYKKEKAHWHIIGVSYRYHQNTEHRNERYIWMPEKDTLKKNGYQKPDARGQYAPWTDAPNPNQKEIHWEHRSRTGDD